jgi:hypothetical protein
MKILKFIELLTENHQADLDELNDVLVDLKDEFITYELHTGYFSTTGISKSQVGDKILGLIHAKPIHEDDKWCYCIEIKQDQLVDNLVVEGRKLIKDKKIFTIFRELENISSRYDNCYLLVNLGISYNPAIYLFILLDTEVDVKDTKLSRIYTEIKNRNISARSDYSYDTTIKLEDDKVIISTRNWSYTDRKFKNLIRGLDFSGFQVQKLPADDSGRIINVVTKI